MFQDILAMGSGGGGGQIPFTLSPYNNRVTVNSQNCYIFNDNGTVKIHYEFNVTATVTETSGSILLGVIPYKVNSNMNETGVFPNSWTVTAVSSNSRLALLGNITNGTTYSMNQDVAVDWN